MTRSKQRLQIANTFLLSLFALGCLFILLYFVPAWKQQSPQHFLKWFSLHGRTLGAIMLPLELIPFVLSLLFYVGAKNVNRFEESSWFIVNVANVFSLFLFPVYFLPVNNMFLEGTIEANKVGARLMEWQVFHSIRTTLAILAAVTSFMILRYNRRRQKNRVIEAPGVGKVSVCRTSKEVQPVNILFHQSV